MTDLSVPPPVPEPALIVASPIAPPIPGPAVPPLGPYQGAWYGPDVPGSVGPPAPIGGVAATARITKTFTQAEALDPALKGDVAQLAHGKLPKAADIGHGAAAFGVTILSSSALLGMLGHFSATRTFVTSGAVGLVVALLHRYVK